MKTVAEDCIVSIRYVMKNRQGEMLENTMDGRPVSYLQGGARILPLLQEQLQGLKAGDKKTVYLRPVHGVNEDDFIFEVIIDQVRAALPEEIMLGYPVQLDTARCEADCYCYKNSP